MSQLLLQVFILVAFAALCFGGGYLTAFIVTRNQWRDQMIERLSPATTGTPANLNGESRRKNRRLDAKSASLWRRP